MEERRKAELRKIDEIRSYVRGNEKIGNNEGQDMEIGLRRIK